MIKSLKLAVITFVAVCAVWCAAGFVVVSFFVHPAHAAIECAEHEFGEVMTTEPTCQRAGRRYRECTVCGYIDLIERLDVIQHSGEWVVLWNSTCNSEGKRAYKCDMCGEIIQTEPIPFSDHRTRPYDVLEATCTEAGRQYLWCFTCGQFVNMEKIPPKGHDYEITVISKPSIVSIGKTKYECTRCGNSFTQGDASMIWVIPVCMIGAAFLAVGVVNYFRAMSHCKKKK